MARRTEPVPTPAPSSTPSGHEEMLPEFFSSDNGEGLPTIDASPPFIYMHHRKRWTVICGKLVPDLSKIPLVSGCNRVLLAPDGRYRFADTQAMFQDRHFKIIQPAMAPNGRSYLRKVNTVQSGKVVRAVISVWETAHAGEAHTEWDLNGYAAWLESLVEKGVIAPITPHRAAEMATRVRTALATAELRVASGKASSTVRVDALKVELAALEKAAKATRTAAKAEDASVVLDMGGA